MASHRKIYSIIAGASPPAVGGAAPFIVFDPVIGAGQPQVGVAIGYTAGSWAGAASVADSWMLDGSAVADAVLTPNYTPVAGDVGKFLSIYEVATDSLGNELSSVSEAKLVVA